LTDSVTDSQGVIMSIVVTGATGHLGRLAVESLLRRGVPADQITATGRNIDKISDLGVPAQRVVYEDVDTLRQAFAGADKLLFISGSEVGQRIAQHRNVVTAAKEAGVGLVAYTSILKADTSDLILAGEHKQTEQMLIDSGLPYIFLRNGWYLENYTNNLAQTLEHGLVGAAEDGKISAATRADFADAAAAALLQETPDKRVYELGGPGFTMTELAAEISRQSGREVSYTNLSPEKYAEVLVGAGVPEGFAAVLADSDRGAAHGALEAEGDDLGTLIGHPPTSLAEVLRAALARFCAPGPAPVGRPRFSLSSRPAGAAGRPAGPRGTRFAPRAAGSGPPPGGGGCSSTRW
jgi:NAD(P)H dehydrogenase (quinone)